MALIPCTGNDTPKTNTWLNCRKSDAIIFYRFEIDIFFTAIKIGTIFLSAPPLT
jgi:hypothetical protein